MAELEPLPDDIAALLGKAKDAGPAPPPGVEDAVLAQVEATVGAAAAAATGAAGAAGASWAGASAASTAWLKPLLGALGLASLIAAVVMMLPARREEVVPARSDTPAPAPEPAPVAPPVPASSPGSAAPPASAPAAPAGAPVAPDVDPPAVPAPPAPRVAEAELIEAARDALARGGADAALGKLQEHARRFGARARLAEEREALTVVAHAQRGAHEEARTAADAFFARYPNSLFSDTVRAAVAAR